MFFQPSMTAATGEMDSIGVSVLPQWSISSGGSKDDPHADRDAEARLLPAALDHGKAVINNRPFDGGALFGAVRGKPLPGIAKEIGCANWAQFFLKWIVSHPAVTCAIPATSQVAHMRENMGTLMGPVPDQAMRRRMAEAFAKL